MLAKDDAQIRKEFHILTFGMPTLPTNINVGLYQMKIDLFVPNPLRCFKCKRFGHGQNTCRGEACYKCGEEWHDGKVVVLKKI